MARARAAADLSIFLAKTFCDTTFFSSLDGLCIVDEKRQESLGLRDLFSSQPGSSPKSEVVISSLVMIWLYKAESLSGSNDGV